MAFSSLKSNLLSHLAFAALLIGGAANAMEAVAQSAYTNIYAHAMVSSAKTDRTMAGGGANFSIAAAVRYTTPLTDRWLFAIGATADNRGFKEQIAYNGQKRVATAVRTTNIEVPFLIIYKPYLFHSAYIGAGAMATFRIKAKTTIEGAPNAETPYGQTRVFDYGPMVVMGYELSDHISLELQGNYNTQGIFKRTDAQQPLQTPLRDFALSLGIGYRF